jgi:hypothetical protein
MFVATQRRSWLRCAIVMSLIVQQVGCGTIFWPERKGQPAGRLDYKVVALDAAGLLLFFVPGVIAFAVDFNNGTIYLPPDQQADSNDAPDRWTAVRTASAHPTEREIEQVLKHRMGKTVRLRPGSYRVGRIDSAEELNDLNFDELELTAACEATHVRFRCQSE